MSNQTVFVAVIEHKHGCNTYASHRQEAVMDAVLAYCREYWTKEGVPGDPDTDIVTRYFAHVADESYIIDETELI